MNTRRALHFIFAVGLTAGAFGAISKDSYGHRLIAATITCCVVVWLIQVTEDTRS